MSAKSGLNRMRLVLDPWAEAAQRLESARREHPRFADVRHLLGLLYLSRGEHEAAEEELRAALSVNPAFGRARLALLVARRLRQGHLDPAAWNREASVLQEEPERSLWTAWFLAQAGDQEGTRRVLSMLAARPETRGAAGYARAVYENAWGRPEEARQSLRAGAGQQSLYREIFERRGWVSPGPARRPSVPFDPGLVLNDRGAASWHPGSADLAEQLGSICARHGLADDALLYYDEAFLRHGSEARYRMAQSQLALARGDEDGAVRALCRAIEVEPTSVPARIALGFEYQSQGYQDEALVQFEVAARLQPDWPDVQYNLGLLYHECGRGGDALRCLRRALETNPAYFQARMSLAQMLLAREAHAEALAELLALERQGVRAADLHVQKAQCLLALDRETEAVAELEAAAALNPGYARTYYILGQAYRRLGLRRKARHAWQQYLERSRRWRDRQPPGDGEETRP